MLKMVDGTGIIGVDMVCPLGGTVSPPQPPNYDKIEVEGVGSLMLPNSLKAPLERVELLGNSTQGENPAPDNPQEIKSAGKWNEGTQKYEIDVKVTGKNLFNAEKARDITNWIVRDNDGYAKFPIRVGKANKVTFSYTEKLTPGKGFYLGITQSETSAVVAWLYHSAETNLNNNKHTVVAAGDYIYLSCTKSGIQKFVDTIQTLQVEISDGQTPYEPYTEQFAKIALDEPLRGIGEYKDTITKDGVVRKILEAPIAEYLQNAIYGNPGEKYISSSVPKCYINYDKNKCMSNIGFASNAENKKYIPIPKLESFSIKVSDDDTVETIKEKMKDVIVAYTTKEPVTEPLPESVQAQLQALHSENGTTHINIDSGEVEAGIKLTYRKEI